MTHTRGVQGGVQIWVLTLGGKLGREHATTQRIKVTLQPVDPETGEDARIADARREGRAPSQGQSRGQPQHAACPEREQQQPVRRGPHGPAEGECRGRGQSPGRSR